MIVCLGTTPTLARTMEFDRLTIDGVNRARRVYEYAAGKSINAARAIRTLGESATSISTAGGATGERLKALAGASGRQEFVTVDAPTRLCVTAVDRRARTSTELIEETAALIVPDGERLLDALKHSLAGARYCLLAGSLASGLGTDFYARCIDICAAADVATILDASGEPLRLASERRPAVIKINAGELATVQAVNGEAEADVSDAARQLAKRTGGWVIVTRGKESTIAVSSAEAWTVSVPKVAVVSAIGSGDSFTGGLAVGLKRGLPMDKTLRLATACAAANAMTADAAHFEVAAAEALIAQIEVRNF